MLRRELHGQRMEGPHAAPHAPQGPPPPPPPPAPPSTQGASYGADPYGNANRTELPPLRSISGSIPNGPDSMTGVQYEAPRVNGYRAERY